MSGRTYSRNIPHRSNDSRDSRDSRDSYGSIHPYFRDDAIEYYECFKGYHGEDRREYVRDDSKHQEKRLRIKNSG